MPGAHALQLSETPLPLEEKPARHVQLVAPDPLVLPLGHGAQVPEPLLAL